MRKNALYLGAAAAVAVSIAIGTAGIVIGGNDSDPASAAQEKLAAASSARFSLTIQEAGGKQTDLAVGTLTPGTCSAVGHLGAGDHAATPFAEVGGKLFVDGDNDGRYEEAPLGLSVPVFGVIAPFSPCNALSALGSAVSFSKSGSGRGVTHYAGTWHPASSRLIVAARMKELATRSGRPLPANIEQTNEGIRKGLLDTLRWIQLTVERDRVELTAAAAGQAGRDATLRITYDAFGSVTPEPVPAASNLLPLEKFPKGAATQPPAAPSQ